MARKIKYSEYTVGLPKTKVGSVRSSILNSYKKSKVLKENASKYL